MKFRFAILAAFAAFVAHCAPVSMRLQVDRAKIYLGESVVVTILVEGSRDASVRPEFPALPPADVSFLGSSDRSSRSITFINGKMSETVFEGRTFAYEIRPKQAGLFRTGDAVLDLPAARGGRVSCHGATVEVTGIEARNDIEAKISCAEKAILVDSPFRIDVSVAIRQLPEPNGRIEPIWRQNPLHMEAAFLDFPETAGLAQPDPEKSFFTFAGQAAQGAPGFTVNNYTRQGSLMSFFDSPFERHPAVFRFGPKTEDRGGTNWWNYSFGLDYSALAEGDYTFGPITVKGAIVTGARPDGSPAMDEVFVVAPAITVRVIPPPEEGRPDWYCGAVGRSLSAKASLDATKCKVGDPLTLSLDMTGEVSAANIRPPTLNLQKGLSDNFRIYDDSIESETIPGGKRFRYRLRPLKAGTLEFPPVKVAYYDTVRPGYVTISTDPLPVKVEATTQIATGLYEEDEAEATLPNATVFASDGGTVAALPFGLSLDLARIARARYAAIWLLPALWLLVVAVRGTAAAVRRHVERTRYGRIAAAALRDFRAARRLAARKPEAAADKAVAALRAFTAAVLSSDNRSLTAPEVAELLTRRNIDPDFAARFRDTFAAIEEIPYRLRKSTISGGAGAPSTGRGARAPAPSGGAGAPITGGGAGAPSTGRGAGAPSTSRGAGAPITGRGAGAPAPDPLVPSSLPILSVMEPLMRQLPSLLAAARATGADTWRTLASVVLVLLLPALSARAELFGRNPDRFDWERAQDALATAQSADDFAAAADAYYAMVRDGAATGPLFHNLGTALLLAGKDRAAAEALDCAARWRGMDSGTAGNRMLAEKAISGAAQLPPERYFLIWHYGLALNTRAALAILLWNVAWGALLLAALLARLPAARHFIRSVAALAAVGFAVFGLSVAVSFLQIRATHSLAAIEGAAAVQEQTPAPQEELP